MRLNKQIAQFLKRRLKETEENSEIYLFGSRVDDEAKGGDIDILWLTPSKIPPRTIRKIRVEFYKKFGWQKIDIVNFTFQDEDPFKNIALLEAIEL